jgi:hypothetical protein
VEHIENLNVGDYITVLRGPQKLESDPNGYKAVLNMIEDRTLVGQPLRVLQVYPPFILARLLNVQVKAASREGGKPTSMWDVAFVYFGTMDAATTDETNYILDVRQSQVMRIPTPPGKPAPPPKKEETPCVATVILPDKRVELARQMPSKSQRRQWRREQKRLRSKS